MGKKSKGKRMNAGKIRTEKSSGGKGTIKNRHARKNFDEDMDFSTINRDFDEDQRIEEWRR